MSTLLMGAGGFLGLNTLDAFQARGLPLKCGRRKRSNVLGLRQRGATLVEVDLDQPETIARAMQSCTTAIHLAGHYPRLSNTPEKTLETGLRQTRAVLDAAASADIQRLIYVSSTATVAPRANGLSTERDRFASCPNIGTYHSLKWEMEAAVDSETRFEVVTVCPGACLGGFDWKIGTSAVLWQLLRGEAPVYPDGIVSWVDARDVASALTALTTRPKVPRRLLLTAGSMRFHELLRLVAYRYGVDTLSAPLSPDEARSLADLEEAKSAVQGGRPRLSRELVDLISHGAAIDSGLSRDALGITYRPLAQTLAAFETWARSMGAHIPTRSEVPA